MTLSCEKWDELQYMDAKGMGPRGTYPREN